MGPKRVLFEELPVSRQFGKKPGVSRRMHPPFSFRLAEKKTGRAQSKRKGAWDEQARRLFVSAGVQRIGAAGC